MIEKQIKSASSSTTATFPLTTQVSARIVFMGTPEFAVASLDKLVEAGCNIVCVITAPDKAAGRGMKLQESAIKKYAVKKGLHILQPEKLKNPEFLGQLKSFRADLQIVVAFRMLPEVVWNMPPLGTINLHGSLLPQYRGAAPINWAIINGEKETGLTTFKLQHEIDTGNILLNTAVPINEDETAGELHDKMKVIGAELLLQTVKGLVAGDLTEAPQPTEIQKPGMQGQESKTMLRHAPKLSTETCLINWNRPIDEIYNLIRGLSPHPAAFTLLEGKTLKVYRADKVYTAVHPAAGEMATDKKTFLHFACMGGYISIKELQLEGKKKMMIQDFLRGYRWG